MDEETRAIHVGWTQKRLFRQINSALKINHYSIYVNAYWSLTNEYYVYKTNHQHWYNIKKKHSPGLISKIHKIYKYWDKVHFQLPKNFPKTYKEITEDLFTLSFPLPPHSQSPKRTETISLEQNE
jgi:hypothetical protein